MGDSSHVTSADPLGEQVAAGVSLRRATTSPSCSSRKTHLPAAIRTRDDDNIHGDLNYDLVLADWKRLAGRRSPSRCPIGSGDVDVAKLKYREVTANPAIAADTFAVPEAIQAAAQASGNGNVPYQWSCGGSF